MNVEEELRKVAASLAARGDIRVSARTRLSDLAGDCRRTAEGLELLMQLIPWDALSQQQETLLYDLFETMGGGQDG